MRTIFRNNGLSIMLLIIFIAALLEQTFTGFQVYNDDQQAHHQPAPVDADPRDAPDDPNAPWPVRRGWPLVMAL